MCLFSLHKLRGALEYDNDSHESGRCTLLLLLGQVMQVWRQGYWAPSFMVHLCRGVARNELPVPRKVKKTLKVLFKYQYFLFSALPCFAVPTILWPRRGFQFMAGTYMILEWITHLIQSFIDFIIPQFIIPSSSFIHWMKVLLKKIQESTTKCSHTWTKP